MSLKTNKALGILEVKAELLNGSFLCLVGLDRLHFPDYQRDAIGPHVKRITDGWDDKAANPVKVNIREARLNCFNGRQTSTAMLRRNMTRCDAIVFDGLTYEQEAHYFFVENNVPKKMDGWKKFHADRIGGNAVNQLILNTIHDHDLTVPGDPLVSKPANADVSKIGSILDAFKIGGMEMVDRICMLLDRVYRLPGRGKTPVQSAAKRTDFLRGLTLFLKANTELSNRSLVQAIRPYMAEDIRAIANGTPSKGRIDAPQIKRAYETIMEGTVKLAKAA